MRHLRLKVTLGSSLLLSYQLLKLALQLCNVQVSYAHQLSMQSCLLAKEASASQNLQTSKWSWKRHICLQTAAIATRLKTLSIWSRSTIDVARLTESEAVWSTLRSDQRHKITLTVKKNSGKTRVAQAFLASSWIEKRCRKQTWQWPRVGTSPWGYPRTPSQTITRR